MFCCFGDLFIFGNLWLWFGKDLKLGVGSCGFEFRKIGWFSFAVQIWEYPITYRNRPVQSDTWSVQSDHWCGWSTDFVSSNLTQSSRMKNCPQTRPVPTPTKSKSNYRSWHIFKIFIIKVPTFTQQLYYITQIVIAAKIWF